VSKTILRLKNVFIIGGILTIRGISKEIKLIAEIDMKNQDKLRDANLLNFNISADIFRNDYGAGGYSGLVSDKIALKSKITVIRTE
jgi:polyisoprenoid-binding protein YceI